MDALHVGIISDRLLMRQALFCLLSTLALGGRLSIVVNADTVEDGARDIAEFKPEIILIDCDAAADCLQCVRSVSTISPSTKVLLLAGQEDEMFAIKAVRSGAWGIINKHTEPVLLQQAIRKLLSGEVWFSHRTLGSALHAFANQQSHEDSPFERLTARETEVLMLLSRGLCNKEIASHLFVAENTIKAYIKVIFRKLGVDSRLKAALSYTKHVELSGLPASLPPTFHDGSRGEEVSLSKPRPQQFKEAF